MAKWIIQAIWFAVFAAGIGYLSTAPAYEHMEPDQALLRLSISHAGQLIGDCHQRSTAELERLPPNMRAAQDCPRERSPVSIEVEVDGSVLYSETIQPSGLSRDGASTVYRRFPLAAGQHRIAVRLKDSARQAGFNYQRSELVQLAPGQVMVIDFNHEKGVMIK